MTVTAGVDRLRDESLDLRGPRPSVVPRPGRLPVVALVAPVFFAAAAFALTGSALAWLFALFSPIIALGARVDGAVVARRLRRTEASRFDAELAATKIAVVAAHDRERAIARHRVHDATELTDGDSTMPSVWRGHIDGAVPVSVGEITRASGVRVSGHEVHSSRDARAVVEAAAIDSLHRDAAELLAAPSEVDARLGIGVAGPLAIRVPLLRSLVVQLSAGFGPDTHAIHFPRSSVGQWSWGSGLPHEVSFVPQPESSAECIRFVPHTGAGATSTVVLAGADDANQLPRECGVVVLLGCDGAQLVAAPRGRSAALDPVGVTAAQSIAWARRARHLARARGHGTGDAAAVAMRGLSGFLPPRGVAEEQGLAGVFAVDAVGAVRVDLVSDGPHAIVAGVTGSGKSELLTSWILSMCGGHSPNALNVLLFDFKGGAQFDALSELPHVVGVITDLDGAVAARALASLRAELTRREGALRDAGLRSVDDPECDLPRLVIVVDEFAVLVARLPELHEVVVDIAARGRSLGMHLILCTQRVAGVVRESVLANCPLRFCLRVASAADSVALLGSTVAASVRSAARGSAYWARVGEPAIRARVILSTGADIEVVGQRWPVVAVHRPWLPELPRELALDDVLGKVGGDLVPFGLRDKPEQQAQDVAAHDPRYGAFVVIGGARSGKSTALRTVSFAAAARAMSVRAVSAGAEAAWDAVAEAWSRFGERAASRAELLVIDDLDVVIADLPDEYQAAFVERIHRLVRRGTEIATFLAFSTSTPAAGLRRLIADCSPPLVLRLPGVAEHTMTGEAASTFDPVAPPGRGRWRGALMQVALPESEPRPPQGSGTTAVELSRIVEAWRPRGSTIVVSTRAAALSAELRTSGVEDVVLLEGIPDRGDELRPVDEGGTAARVFIGDPDAWQARWSLLVALRGFSEVVLDGCSPAEVRAITRSTTAPPPWSRGLRAVWVCGIDGGFRRARFPQSSSKAIGE